MKYFRTGDSEPGPDVDVLLLHIRTAAQAPFLARFQHGWVWVHRKADVGRATPLRWDFATGAEPDGDPTELRTMNAEEYVEWLTG